MPSKTDAPPASPPSPPSPPAPSRPASRTIPVSAAPPPAPRARERGRLAGRRRPAPPLVADHEVGGGGRLGRERRELVRPVPERRPPVEVEDRRAAVRAQRLESGLAARRLREPRAGG